jgi:hypothetical protein
MVAAVVDCVLALCVGFLIASLLPTRWPTDPKEVNDAKS